MSKNQTSQEDRYNRFVTLLTRSDQTIRRFVRSLLPSQEGVDDVVQDTALECWRKFADYEANDSENELDEFIRWACVIARFKVLSRHRDSSRDRLVFRESVLKQLADTALDRMDHLEAEREAIEHCLGKMEAGPKRLLLSVYRPGDSIARVAKETGQQARRLYSKIDVLRKLLLDCVKQKLAEEN